MSAIPQILSDTRTIAIVGLSANTSKASHEVALYLMPHYKIIPINPRYEEVLGLKCYPDIASVPMRIDLLDVFQRSEAVMPLVLPSINAGISCFWMQMGIWDEDAKALLEAKGIDVVQDKCTKVEHARLLIS
ncbi:MAG: putative CoA-binding protein [Candidatus Azotimanducaceae bacterium]|jgi:predicted CoA-binding protein